jgi:integrase
MTPKVSHTMVEELLLTVPDGAWATFPGYAGLRVRRGKNGVQFSVRYWDKIAGEQRQSGKDTLGRPLRDLDQALAYWKDVTRAGEKNEQPIAQGRVLFSEIAAEAFEYIKTDRRIGESARRSYTDSYRLHLAAPFGRKPVRSITPDDWRKFVARLEAKKCAPSSIRTYLNAAEYIYKVARINARTSFTLRGIDDLYPASGTSEDFDDIRLRPEDMTLVTMAATEEMTTPLQLIAGTGMRRSECAGLKWSDFDFLGLRKGEPAVFVIEQLGRRQKGVKEARRVGTKSKNSGSKKHPRMVPLGAKTRALMEAHFQREVAAGRGKDDDYVFVSSRPGPHMGKPISSDSLYAACVKAGEVAGFGEKIGPLVLRRSYCTHIAWMIDTGQLEMSQSEAARNTGHSVKTWRDTYVGHYEDEATAKVLGDALTKAGF